MPKAATRPAAQSDPAEEMRQHAHDAALLLKSMANESRLLVLCALAQGERSVGELNEMVPLSQSALSQHLSVLREASVVTTRRESQTIYYRLADGGAAEVMGALHGVFCAPQTLSRKPRIKKL